MSTQFTITEATKADCDAISVIAKKTFSETFGHLYRPENLAAHLALKFSPEFFETALEAGDTLLLLKENDLLVGYSQVGHVSLPVKGAIPKGAQELHRVYIDKAHQNRGYGKQTMVYIFNMPRMQTAPIIYLGVWEENLGAQALYKHYGFEVVGKYLYQVVDQYDHEFIMARKR